LISITQATFDIKSDVYPLWWVENVLHRQEIYLQQNKYYNKRPTGLDTQLADIVMNTTKFFDNMGSYS